MRKLINIPLLLDSSMSALAFKRTYSTTATRQYKEFNPELLALKHINSGNPTTASVINNILLNQDITVTDSKLKDLLKVEGVEFNLYTSSSPVAKEESKLFSELTGTSNYKGHSGVYMFIHKTTGQKYVGSSNLLRRRMDYYFKGDFTPPLRGKFLPLLTQEGLGAFKLIIFKLDNNKFNVKDALILEQYHLLSKEFVLHAGLNTLRVVNVGSSKGESVYVYDLTCSTLYYHASSRIELKRTLKIHPETCKKFLNSNLPYLNRFLLLSGLIPTAVKSNMSVLELLEIMQKERQTMYTLGTRRSLPVILEIKEGNKFVLISLASGASYTRGQTLKFESLTACISYLRDLGLIIKRETLSKYIKIEKEFHHFLCKYSDNTKPDNFEEVGLIIDEYKKLWNQELVIIPKVNKKNKRVLVKGPDFEKEFETITDTIKYFESIGIKLDRKYLNLKLKSGEPYKGYYFYFK